MSDIGAGSSMRRPRRHSEHVDAWRRQTARSLMYDVDVEDDVEYYVKHDVEDHNDKPTLNHCDHCLPGSRDLDFVPREKFKLPGQPERRPTLLQRYLAWASQGPPRLFWLFPISLWIGQLYLAPYVPMETHMTILDQAPWFVTYPWWTVATSGRIQEEYWRRKSQRDLGEWIDGEKEVAWEYLLRNIGPLAGADDGIVIASPSRAETAFEPDYYYTWTRDAALTMSTVISSFLPDCYAQPWVISNSTTCVADAPEGDISLEPLIRAYVAAQSRLQVTPNPSGDLWTGGLNEPKFNVDGSRFDDEWGRPQRDGPALRALALIPYAHYLLDRSWPADMEYVRSHLYDPHALRKEGSVIKNDLEEVGGGWWLSSFDLWEEVNGHHLFTLLACLRALQAGAQLADRLDDAKAAEYYSAQAYRLSGILPAFWNDTGYWQSTAHIDDLDVAPEHEQRAWLDCSFPLSIIHAGSDDSFAATEPETLAGVRAYIRSFDGLYPINSRPATSSTLQSWIGFKSQPSQAVHPWPHGWAVGRYAEDAYNGIGTGRANPWHICTYSVAHVIYLAKDGFERQGYIPLNNLTRPFWADVLGEKYKDRSDVWTRDDAKGPFDDALRALGDVADRYMKVGRRYAPEGRMSEQIDRTDGTPVGARDLTWSYASFLEAARARDRAGA